MSGIAEPPDPQPTVMDDDSELGALISELWQNDKLRLRAAVDALTRLAQVSAAVRARLCRELTAAPSGGGWAVAYVLAQAPKPDAEAVRRLLDGLDHPDADIRWAIGLLLVRLARADDEIMIGLNRLCAAGNAVQRRMAVYCLRDIDREDPGTAEVLLSALHDSDPLVRMAAADAFKRKAALPPSAKKALLQVFMEDRENRVRSVAAIALARMGDPSAEFLRELERAENGDNEQLRRAATMALSYLENKRAASSSG